MGKHLSQTSPTGDMFNDDLISEILVRLPVKSLLRFKSVSKSWFSLISNPNFKKSHFRLAIGKAEAEQTLIIREVRESDTLISLLDLNSGKVVADLNFPYSKCEVPSLRSSFVVGSACGIVCVCVDMRSPNDCYEDEPDFSNRELNVYLWNPATKQSKLIPPYTIIHDDDDFDNVSIGFGYDPIGDDFKVIRVSSAYAEVYSTNRNAWTKVDPNPVDVPFDDIFNCCVNGYMCSRGWSANMMAFDLNKEILSCGIKFPVTSYDDACITDYNDCIAVIMLWERVDITMEGNNIVKLWTLDDEACLHGSEVKGSWTLKLSVEMVLDFVHGYLRGDLLLVAGDVWTLYNCETKEEKCLQYNLIKDEIFKYTESLVSIEGSKQVSWDGNWNEDQVEDEGYAVEGEEEENDMMEEEVNDIIRLWTLDDETCLRDSGVKASWTLKLSVEIDFLSDFVYGYFRGDLLLSVGATWILYNCETKEEKCIQDPYVRDEIFKYTKSLVSIEGSKQVSWDGNWSQDQVEDEGEDEGEREFMFDYDYDYEDEVEFDYGVAVEDKNEGEFDYVYEGEDGVAVEDEDADEDEDEDADED